MDVKYLKLYRKISNKYVYSISKVEIVQHVMFFENVPRISNTS